MAKRKYVRAPVVAPVVTDVAIIPAAGDAPPNAIQAEQPPQDNDHVAEGAEQFPEPPQLPVVAPVVRTPKKAIESLIDYARRIEIAAQPLAVCQITHPDAKNGAIHEGTYAGIRLIRGGELSALLSDGSTL